MNRKELSNLLEETALYLDLAEANPFRARAYHNAARALLKSGLMDHELLETDRLKEIKGIGAGLAESIVEAATAGHIDTLDELRAEVPRGLYEMTRVPGLGPKKILQLHRDLGVTSLGELAYACDENRLVGLKGFGSKSQTKIREGIEFMKRGADSFLYPDAVRVAADLVDHFAPRADEISVEVTGDLRRLAETTDRVELLAVSTAPQAALTHFSAWIKGSPLNRHGEARVSIRHPGGPVVELEAVTPTDRTAALIRTTGSAAHLERLAQLAAQRGLEMTDAGLTRHGRPLEAADEEAFYRLLGLAWIPPELREDAGEIGVAAAGEIPRLVDSHDIRGVLHVHTSASDGGGSLMAMAEAALELGYGYLGLTDHSVSAFYAGGLDSGRLMKQSLEVERVNNALAPFRVFHGVESDITADGGLDYPDEVLGRLDFVIASVHSNFNLSLEKQTMRIVRAVEHPRTTILGHPTGRLLLARDAYRMDMDAVCRAAAGAGVALEINAHPARLDTDWRVINRARALGLDLKYAICPDAHAADGLTDTAFGVNVARKGGLGPAEVLNCLEAPALEAHFRQKGK